MVIAEFPYREVRYGQRVWSINRAGREGGYEAIHIYGIPNPYKTKYIRLNTGIEVFIWRLRAKVYSYGRYKNTVKYPIMWYSIIICSVYLW